MRALAIAAVIGTGLANLTWAQGHADCPMAASKDHRAGVDHRHDEATGVGHDASEHQFLLSPDGGSIRLEVTDPGDVAGRDRIRGHLQGIATAFGEGDFSLPMRIHDQVPPGVEVMKARRTAIRYSYAPTEKGGIVTLSTKDAEAVEAVHDFLRFQISDHGTADPTE
jgi:hypothetical protein